MFRLLLALCLTACTHSSIETEEEHILSSIEWSVEDCSIDATAFHGIRVEQTDIDTVVRVHWATTEPELGALFFELDGMVQQTPWSSDPTTQHEALILGVPPHTEIPFALAKGVPSQPQCSGGWLTQNGGIPSALPELSLETTVVSQTLGGFIAAPAITTGQSFLTIIDSQGRYVWAQRHEELVWRMRMGLDNRSILFNHSAEADDEIGPIYRMSFDGTLIDTIEIDGSHRDFVELPDGTISTFVWQLQTMVDPKTGEERTIVGDALVEALPSGEQRQVWSIWDQHTPSLTEAMTKGLYPADLDAEEWTHANGLTYLPEDDSYLISLDAWNSIVKVDRQTGEELWFLSGGTGGDFHNGELGLVSNAHSVRPTEDGALLIFNRNDFAQGECAEAVEVDIDEAQQSAHMRWRYGTDDCQVVTYLGISIPFP